MEHDYGSTKKMKGSTVVIEKMRILNLKNGKKWVRGTVVMKKIQVSA